ncbi:MAG: hypothetical protein AUI47_06535 [Acidobacteria bacterium 13_1_40CM_2_68_5]|nr:MAG: hypothetical protein AUI47_06535 [Acidobacteria bacterium 13_1_40CM_2_68_5]OLE76150.1 MAG: hypothetical protein AUG02_05785 [Chloroflexi bacterium 13_1_20CM_2_70_9]
MSLAMSLRGRGALGSAARTTVVLSRFGLTARAMAERLDRYEAILSELAIRPTWPATACVVARHPALLRAYAERGAELALHGLVHGDHRALDEKTQRETIARAADIFDRAGIAASGFRGPYLRYNEATLAALRELGLRYHSSQAVAFPILEPDPSGACATSYDLALELYGAQDARRVAVRPRLDRGLVDIPVAIPDDEILVERLRLTPSAAAAEWGNILALTHERGDLFVVQLHPERILELRAALSATLRDARRRQPCVLVSRLDEIAAWWLRRSRFSLRVTRGGADRYRIRVEADPDATVLVRGLEVARRPWHGADALSELRDFEVEARRMPVVGVSRRSPEAVRDFLLEEGLPCEVSDERHAYGAYVDVAGPAWAESDVLDSVDGAPGPLVRIWRWPSGARSALAVTGDIDALTLFDFLVRSWETRSPARGGWSRS